MDNSQASPSHLCARSNLSGVSFASFLVLYNQRCCMAVTTLQEKLASAAARLENYRGADTPVSFGNPAAEFRALLDGCGLYDLNWQAKLGLSGENPGRWLNGHGPKNSP